MSSEPDKQGAPLKDSVERLKTELDRWLEIGLEQGEKALDAMGLRSTRVDWVPPMNVYESTDQVFVALDVPGVAPEAVDVSIAGNMLTVVADWPSDDMADYKVHACERPSGRFQRAIPLPVAVKSDEVTAEVKDGVLRITIAKSEEAIPRQVQITTGESSEG